MCRLLLCCLFAAAPSGAHADEPYVYRNADVGFTLELPDEQWQVTDHGQGIAQALVFSPNEALSPRCSVLYLPALILPEGLLAREKQFSAMLGEKYERLVFDKTQLDGREVDHLRCRAGDAIMDEYAFRDDDFVVIFQLAAEEPQWEDPEIQATLERIRNSFHYSGAHRKGAPQADASTPEQIRAKRRAMQRQGEHPFELTQHRIAAEIRPAEGSIRVEDVLTIRARQANLDQLELMYSVVRVDAVEAGAAIEWSTSSAGNPPPNDALQKLTIRFAEPLGPDATIDLTVRTSSDDYFYALDQKLVAEVAVMGQVRATSSYSSHVIYYPIDQRNDAAVDFSITVPADYTAVTGGAFLGVDTTGDESTYRYRSKVRTPRILPFGFAVAQYISQSGKSAAGLPISVYGYAGEEVLIGQRLAAAIDAANQFERMMGPLPFAAVRFAHVSPERK